MFLQLRDMYVDLARLLGCTTPKTWNDARTHTRTQIHVHRDTHTNTRTDTTHTPIHTHTHITHTHTTDFDFLFTSSLSVSLSSLSLSHRLCCFSLCCFSLSLSSLLSLSFSLALSKATVVIIMTRFVINDRIVSANFLCEKNTNNGVTDARKTPYLLSRYSLSFCLDFF